MHSIEPPIRPICSIIIPAHNEEGVIETTLQSLLLDAREDEFQIIVICNGCTDNTAQIAKKTAPNATVVTTPIPSKVNALNIGIQHAKHRPIVFLDADIKTSSPSVRSLVHRLAWSGALMTYGKANFITNLSSLLVRSFYRAWRHNPYFDKGKVGGYFAVSREGCNILGDFPDIINDDEYVRRRLSYNSTFAGGAPYYIMAPRTLYSLIKVRSRIYRGNDELKHKYEGLNNYGQKKGYVIKFIIRLIQQPNLWFGALIFAVTTMIAHARNKYLPRTTHWEKDMTSRASPLSSKILYREE